MKRTIDTLLPADRPGLPDPKTFTLTEPLPPEQWPALSLSWRDIAPTVLECDRLRGDLTDSLLFAEGALGPVALVGKPPARYGRGWLWRCQVHTLWGFCASAQYVSRDCTRSGMRPTRDEAREAARRHVTDHHQDAAVPYTARYTHFVRRWTR
ncbi:hypothetical protein [Actinacidiphila soli]|uniref:hypothetical protein n=1 Tax=Actinacidiphila soli TaxID=2487275 RepID=UPI000FCA1EFE|nr:hypothetical protein [Actinacidiphila soli]